MANYLRWLVVFATLVINSIAIQLSQYLGLLVLPFSKQLFRNYVRFTMRAWGVLIVLITSWFSPTKIVVSGDGDKMSNDHSAILMANHQTFADWWYLWILAYERNLHGNLKIILKSAPKYIPIFGWGMYYFFEFIFLKRNWTQDQKILDKTLAAYREPSSAPFWLIIFPEGTIIREQSKKQGEEYAKKNNLPSFQHMLVPRTTGLYFCWSHLRHSVKYIYDVTIAYKGTQAGQYPSLVYKLGSIFLDGKAPPSIHMHVRRFDVKTIPVDEEEFNSWLFERYREKDELLTTFYRDGFFNAKRRTEEVAVHSYFDLLLSWVITLSCGYGLYSLFSVLF